MSEKTPKSENLATKYQNLANEYEDLNKRYQELLIQAKDQQKQLDQLAEPLDLADFILKELKKNYPDLLDAIIRQYDDQSEAPSILLNAGSYQLNVDNDKARKIEEATINWLPNPIARFEDTTESFVYDYAIDKIKSLDIAEKVSRGENNYSLIEVLSVRYALKELGDYYLKHAVLIGDVRHYFDEEFIGNLIPKETNKSDDEDLF